jgi:protein-disulfide isomerase
MPKKISIFPLTIIIIGIIIASGIFISRSNIDLNLFNSNTEITEKTYEISPITEKDHILGNPNADIIIVEYSDFECPFCAQFHPTMQRLMEEFGPTGRVAWVYRHFPVEQIHKNARAGAIASECVANISGEKAFWDFTNTLFNTPSTEFSPEKFLEIATSLKVDPNQYENCFYNNKNVTAKIDSEIQDALTLFELDPDFGTPYNIVITKTGERHILPGTIPYADLKEIIETYSLPKF